MVTGDASWLKKSKIFTVTGDASWLKKSKIFTVTGIASWLTDIMLSTINYRSLPVFKRTIIFLTYSFLKILITI